VGLRYRKSKKIGPFRFTLSKSGLSASVGVKGLRVTKMANGRVRTTASIPGTGVSYVKERSARGKPPAAKTQRFAAQPPQTPAAVVRYDGDLPFDFSGEEPEEPKTKTIPPQHSTAGPPKGTVFVVVCLAVVLLLAAIELLGGRHGAAPTQSRPPSKTVVIITPAPTPTPAPTTASTSVLEPVVSTTAASFAAKPTAEPANAVGYVANTNTGRFHKPSCSSVDEMAEKNKVCYDVTRSEMIAMGYVPCKRCNP
jgi:hypothetical protein